ncbi:MAG: alpha-galactosidase [Saprospiraceae bacterium]
MEPNILLRYNNDQQVNPASAKMTFFEELYIDAKTESVEKGKRISLQIHPKQDVVINELTIKLSYNFQATDQIFCNGFQSQTESLVYKPNESLPSVGSLAGSKWHSFGNYRHPHLKDLSANLHSWTYSYIKRADDTCLLIASLSENTGFTLIKHCCNLNEIKITWEAADFKLAHSFPAMDVIVLEGREKQVFDEYSKLMNIESLENFSPLRSCIAVDTDLDEDFLQKQTTELLEQAVPIDMVLVNEGYPIALGDWLTGSNNATRGIPAASSIIRKLDLKPGIQIAPFLCSSESDFYKNKKQCLLKDHGGELVKLKSEAAPGGVFYVLDFYNNAVTDYLNSMLTALSQQWSYNYLLLDYLHAVCLYPPAHKTMGQVMCEALDFINGICPKASLLTASVPLGAAFGRVAYCELAGFPVNAWKSTWLSWNKVRERRTALANIPTQLNRRQLNQRMFLSSPSLLISGDTKSRYSFNQQQTLLLLNSICRAGFIISEKGNTESSGEQTSEYQQALFDQFANIHSVKQLSPNVLQVPFSNNGKEWIAYANLQRSKARLSHQGRPFELESCESIILQKR